MITGAHGGLTSLLRVPQAALLLQHLARFLHLQQRKRQQQLLHAAGETPTAATSAAALPAAEETATAVTPAATIPAAQETSTAPKASEKTCWQDSSQLGAFGDYGLNMFMLGYM